MSNCYGKHLFAAVVSRDVGLTNWLLAQDSSNPLQGAVILSMDTPRTAANKPGAVFVPVILSRPALSIPETVDIMLTLHDAFKHNNNMLAFFLDPSNPTNFTGAYLYMAV
jgi:hypothetical protein